MMVDDQQLIDKHGGYDHLNLTIDEYYSLSQHYHYC